MTPTDAAHLVERIIQTWPGGTKGRIWTEVLTPLDAGRAGTAYVRLRGETEHPPSPGRFLATYNALDTSRGQWPHQDYSDAISLDEAIANITHYDPEAAANLTRYRHVLP